MAEQAFWWCAKCEEEVSESRVTFQERHDVCGNAVEALEDTTLVSELAALRQRVQELEQERDAERNRAERAESQILPLVKDLVARAKRDWLALSDGEHEFLDGLAEATWQVVEIQNSKEVASLEKERDKAEKQKTMLCHLVVSYAQENYDLKACVASLEQQLQQERNTNPISRRDFLKLPMSERRRLLREQSELLRALSRDSDAMEEKGMME